MLLLVLYKHIHIYILYMCSRVQCQHPRMVWSDEAMPAPFMSSFAPSLGYLPCKFIFAFIPALSRIPCKYHRIQHDLQRLRVTPIHTTGPALGMLAAPKTSSHCWRCLRSSSPQTQQTWGPQKVGLGGSRRPSCPRRPAKKRPPRGAPASGRPAKQGNMGKTEKTSPT